MNSINLTRIDDGEAVSEYYKQLRTNIYFCGQDKQCIAFTSSFPNEGKSTVVFNLCKALAEDGYIDVLGTDAHNMTSRPPQYWKAATT